MEVIGAEYWKVGFFGDACKFFWILRSFHFKVRNFRENLAYSGFRRFYRTADSSDVYGFGFACNFYDVEPKVGFNKTYVANGVSESEFFERFYHCAFSKESEVSTAVGSARFFRVFTSEFSEISSCCFGFCQEFFGFSLSFFLSTSGIRSSGLASLVGDEDVACFYGSGRFFGNHTAEFDVAVFFVRTKYFTYRKSVKGIGVSRADIVFIYESAIVRYIRVAIDELFDILSFSESREGVVAIGFAVVHDFGLQEFEQALFFSFHIFSWRFFGSDDVLDVAVSFLFELFFVFFDVILNLAVGNGNIFIVDAAVLEGNIVDIGEVFFLVVFHFGFGIGNAESSADEAEIHLLFSALYDSVFLDFPLSIGFGVGAFEGS